MLSRLDMHHYQDRGVDFIIDRKRCGLFLFMGAGKTATTLTAIADLYDQFAIQKVLIIAPLRVAASVWPAELELWSHLNHLSVSVVLGSERNRLAALMKGADIYTINRENVPWLVAHYGQAWPFDMVVIDESSSFKNPSSKRFKALKKVMPNTEYLVLLTGTPAPNGLLDLWSQLYLIDFGEALGRTMSGFKRRFFIQEGYMGYKLRPADGAMEAIQDLITPHVLSMQAEDYIELPGRIDITQVCTLPITIQKKYVKFERQLLAEFDGVEIEAASAAVLANKLLQFCNGAMITDSTGAWVEIHKVKLDALEDIVDDNPNENILVAYNYKADLARLLDRFPQAVVLGKDPETIKQWNDGKIPLLLAHPASAGHGLNLQKGGSLAVWFSLHWSLEYYLQFNARLHRQGQTMPVRVIHLVIAGGIDERVMDVLGIKDATQDAMLRALV